MSAVPIIIASQSGSLNGSTDVAVTLMMLCLSLIILFVLITLAYCGDYKKNMKKIKNND